MSSSGRISFRVVDPTFEPDWDATVLSRFPQAGSFHTAAWAGLLRATYAYSPHYLIADESGSDRLLLPILEIRSWLTGVRGVALPFTDECAPLATNSALFAPAFREVLNLGERHRWKYFELRGGQGLWDGATASLSFHHHTLPLIPDPTQLFAKFYGTVRTSVRKAEQNGVVVEFSESPAAIREFYTLLCKTRSRHGLPPQPPEFFENIQQHLLRPRQGTVALAKQGPNFVAGAVFFHFGKTAIYKYAASDDRFRNLQGNNLVLWRAIERYAQAGYTSLDFGRTSLHNEGLRRFKLSWQTKESRLDYFRYLRSDKRFVTTVDQASEGIHTRLFRAAPPGLSRLIGKALYKHLG